MDNSIRQVFYCGYLYFTAIKDCAKHRFRIYRLIFHMCVCVCSGITILQQITSNTFHFTLKDSVFVFLSPVSTRTMIDQVKVLCPLGIVHQFDYRSTFYSQVAKSLPPRESETSGKPICILAGKIRGGIFSSESLEIIHVCKVAHVLKF